MFSFIPPKQETSTHETNCGGYMGEKFMEICCVFSPPFLNFIKRTKRIFIEKSCIFSSEGRSNTVCEMRVAWVWLFQKASACHCLPSQLLQAPAPWLPYMRDQGLPRCFWERRAQCEMGQTSPQNTHFLCMLGALVGIQMGSLTQQLGFFFSFPPRCS